MTGPGFACPVCATPTVPGARFCFQCGTALGDAAEIHGEHGGERRVVTVLFGDLSEFTAWAEDLDPERVGLVTDRVLVSLAQTVAAYGGHVDKLTGDGIMAVFGAPQAHEDDAERAVRAALQMQEEVGRLVAEESGGGRQLGLRVGLNTGEVLAGVRASLSYTVVGDAVNTASRLSDAAGVGAVLAGRDTAVPTMSVASWRALPPLRLKGKREPVEAYELIGLRRRPATRLGLGDEAPLTGREAELGLLVSRIRDATERGRPASLVLTGEAGLGKTRLWRELARIVAEMPGSRVLVGRCEPYGRARDLAPVVEMVRTACGITDEDSDDTARERARRLVSRLEHPARAVRAVASAATLGDTLLTLLGLPDERGTLPREGVSPGEAERRGDDLAVALAWLFDALAAEGPLLLVVDDLHWSGPGLLDLLGTVSERVRGPVTILAVGRHELLEHHADWTSRLPDPALLPLAPLEDAAAERLLRAYLGGSELEQPPRRELLDRAQGNPFFLAEMLHLLVDRGLLRRDPDGSWTVTGPVPSRVLPAGVHAVLAARIDELPPAPRATLRDAAVVGGRFSVDALVALSGDDSAEVVSQLTALVEHEVVVPQGDDAFAFAHTLTREVAYAGIPKIDRARRHATVARWAATGLPGGPAEVDVYVAGQADLALALADEMRLPEDDPARAARLLGGEALARLGCSALARDDNVTAADLLARALAVAGEALPERSRRAAEIAYAEALAALHRLDEALVVLTPALEDPRADDLGSALVVLGEVRRKQGDDHAATEAFVRAVTAAADAGDDRVVANALRQLGLMDYFAGRLRSAQRHFEQALDLARRVGDQRGTGWALQHLAWNATSRGDFDAADDALRRASDVFSAFGDLGGVAWCVGTEALVRVLQGRLHEARALVASVTAPARESGDQFAIAACLTIDSIAASELGDAATAAAQSAEAVDIYAELGDAWGLSRALLARGLAARSAGDRAAATEFLSQAVTQAEQLPHPTIHALALVALGWCFLGAGHLDQAEEAALRATAVTEELALEQHPARAERVLLAAVARARGDVARSIELLDGVTAGDVTPTMLSPVRRALAEYADALLDAGRVAEAVEAAERAADVAGEDVASRVVSLRTLTRARAAAQAAGGAPAG